MAQIEVLAGPACVAYAYDACEADSVLSALRGAEMKRRAFIKALAGVAISLAAIYGEHFKVAELHIESEAKGPWAAWDNNNGESVWLIARGDGACPECFGSNVARNGKQHSLRKCYHCGLIWDENVLAGRAWNVEARCWQTANDPEGPATVCDYLPRL